MNSLGRHLASLNILTGGRALTSTRRALIYMKDKDLDKSSYKPSEADYIKQYI